MNNKEREKKTKQNKTKINKINGILIRCRLVKS